MQFFKTLTENIKTAAREPSEFWQALTGTAPITKYIMPEDVKAEARRRLEAREAFVRAVEEKGGEVGTSWEPEGQAFPTVTPTPTETPGRRGLLARFMEPAVTTHMIEQPIPPTPAGLTPTPTPTPTPMPTPFPLQDSFSYAPLEEDYANRQQIPKEYRSMIEASAQWHGVPTALLSGLLKTESRSFDRYARNYNSGNDTWDRGLAQINSGAYYWITDEQADDPAFAIDFAAARISDLLNKWKTGVYSDPAQAIAVYNQGPWAPLQGFGTDYAKTVWGFAELPFTPWVE